MKVEEISKAIAKLPPDQLKRLRRSFTLFEAGRAGYAKELCRSRCQRLSHIGLRNSKLSGNP
jgi:hypothetical protein